MSDIIKLDFSEVTKTNAKELGNQLAEVVAQGMVNSLDAYTRLKAIELMVSEARKQIDDIAKNDLSKYDKSEKVVFNGYELTQREAGVRYDFSECNDEEYNRAASIIAIYTKVLKERETFLKTLKVFMNVVNEDGEAVTIYPPVKSSTTSIVCS